VQHLSLQGQSLRESAACGQVAQDPFQEPLERIGSSGWWDIKGSFMRVCWTKRLLGLIKKKTLLRRVIGPWASNIRKNRTGTLSPEDQSFVTKHPVSSWF
jgi:hypothetical protein